MGKKYIDFFRNPIGLFLTGFFLMGSPISAQTFEPKILEGKVHSDDGDVAATHVLNTTTKKAVITDIEGRFSIVVHLYDTLVFSAVQYKKKTLVVSAEVMQGDFISVALEAGNIALDEVVVTPYNLTGELGRDMERLDVAPGITASGLGLPNANVKPLMQSERLLREASMGPLSLGTFTSIPFNPIINAISGRTKMLKERVARDRNYRRTEQLERQFSDSVFVTQLRVPFDRIDDFLYFCEVDADFKAIVDGGDLLKLWDFLLRKSAAYRENNGF